MKHHPSTHALKDCKPNPAASLTPISAVEWIKIVLMSVLGIAPFRFVLILTLFSIGGLLAKIGVLSMKRSERHTVNNIIPRVMWYIIRFGARLVMYIGGFTYVFTDGFHDQQANLLVATHTSLWDSIWLLFYIGATQAAKSELFEIPIIGDYLRLLESLPIDRNSEGGRRRAITDIQRRVSDPSYPPLVIFPTACCCNSRQLIHFKRGAFEPLSPIQPIGIFYPCRNYDMKLSKSSLWDLYRSVCQIQNYMSVTFLPIRYPNAEERRDPSLWASKVREEMAAKLGMQLVDYRFEDEVVRTSCRDKNVFLNELKLHIVDFRLTEKCIDAFALIDSDGDGWLSFEDFQSFRGSEFTRTEFGNILQVIKLPPIPIEEYTRSQNCESYDSWTEKGFIGWLTGGRPTLAARPIDPYFRDKLEFAEIVTYMNNLLHKPSPSVPRIQSIVEMFGLQTDIRS